MLSAAFKAELSGLSFQDKLEVFAVTDEAENELTEGYRWYEGQAQLGSACMTVVGKQFEFIEAIRLLVR